MAMGTVKWFNAQKGYGFIEPNDGGNDVFVHISALQAAGIDKLLEGQTITYELVDGLDGRKMAGDLNVAEASSD